MGPYAPIVATPYTMEALQNVPRRLAEKAGLLNFCYVHMRTILFVIYYVQKLKQEDAA